MIGIAFILGVECLLAGSFDRVLQQVEQTSDAGRLALVDQLLGIRMPTSSVCM